MRRFMLLTGCALALLLGGAVSAAQPLTVPVLFPVRGNYAVAVGDNRLYIVDTFTGALSLLSQGETTLDSPVWDATGQYLAYGDGRIASTILDMASGSLQVIHAFPERNASDPQDWSSDGSRILYISSKFTLEGLVAFNLDMFDVGSGTLVNLLHYDVDQPLTTVPLPPLPTGVSGLAFREVIQASWNPVYEEWIAVQLTGFTPDFDMSELVSGAKFPITLVYNRNTGQMLSLDQLIPDRISSSPLTWSPDGTRLIVQTAPLWIPTTRQYVVALREIDGDWSLDTLDRVEEDVVIVDWLGVEDLLLAYTRQPDDWVFYVAQISDGVWESTEFFRIPNIDTMYMPEPGDWHLAATPEEQAALSCLFDATQPARLAVGGQGQVAFTDGTPSRLRDAPGLDGAQVALMAEGTPFDVIGGPWCADGYRWWQLQLADGTQGWSAEADAAGYFLE